MICVDSSGESAYCQPRLEHIFFFYCGLPLQRSDFTVAMSTQPRPYTLCSTPAAVTDAVAVLHLSEYLVLDCEGKDIGRTDGLLSVICIGTAHAEHIFVFDTLALTRSEPAMAPLLDLMKNERVCKVVWDGRQDFLEILDNYGVRLGGVLDLQLAEVTSRSAVRGEDDRRRLYRLSSGYLSFQLAKKIKKDLSDIHLVIGLQKCLELTRLQDTVGKDGNCLFRVQITAINI
jgi:exonuclease 3'-5' domain-containing protein 1